MPSNRPLSNGPSANVPSISKDTTPIQRFQLELVEAMVELTKVRWNNCPESLARKVCQAKLEIQVAEVGDDPDTLRAWFEEWRLELLFELGT